MRFDADVLRKAKTLKKYHAVKDQKRFKILSVAAITGLAFCATNTQKANAAPLGSRAAETKNYVMLC